jgi:hypothetical protein
MEGKTAREGETMNAIPGLPYTLQPEDGGFVFILHVGINLQDCTVSQPGRPQFEKL